MSGYYFIYTGLLAWTVYSVAKAAAKMGAREKLLKVDAGGFIRLVKEIPKMAVDGFMNKIAGPDWHQFWMAEVVVFNAVLYMYVIPILRVRVNLYVAVAVTLGFWFFAITSTFILHKKAISFRASH